MSRRGYTLLEVMVATVIMAVAVVSLLSSLSTSLQNASRLTDYDRAVMMAKRTMNELLANPNLPKGTVIESEWDPAAVGVRGGWRAHITPFERAPRANVGGYGMERLELEIWWARGEQRRTLTLDAYRAAAITRQDLELGIFAP